MGGSVWVAAAGADRGGALGLGAAIMLRTRLNRGSYPRPLESLTALVHECTVEMCMAATAQRGIVRGGGHYTSYLRI
jgi:hypothetical protein